jgi:hypothetical protein
LLSSSSISSSCSASSFLFDFLVATLLTLAGAFSSSLSSFEAPLLALDLDLAGSAFFYDFFSGFLF